ncbi:hypothetical protein [Halovivax sp.]|uniref:DUF7528 family protein n=1 Tax=Halovivax sp. TaxID=1935978 RepID=UPI0025BF4510|nr:hypothetical protein [Halovivax sp.]
MAVSAAGDAVELRLGDETVRLPAARARELRRELGDALRSEREFVNTVGRTRADGRYVVERREATSAGHRKVFDSFADAVGLFDALPETFTAADVGGHGLTGSRRHALVWHYVEHPAFDCELVRRQPLTARKGRDSRSIDAASGTLDGGNPRR